MDVDRIFCQIDKKFVVGKFFVSKNEDLVFHGTALAILLINGLFYAKTKTFRISTRISTEFSEKNNFYEISIKPFSQCVLLILKFYKKFPKTHRRIFSKAFPSFTTFRDY